MKHGADVTVIGGEAGATLSTNRAGGTRERCPIVATRVHTLNRNSTTFRSRQAPGTHERLDTDRVIARTGGLKSHDAARRLHHDIAGQDLPDVPSR